MAGLDSLTNVESKWNLSDLLDSHEALDIKEEAEAFAMEQSKR